MEGVIANFRSSLHRQSTNQMVVRIPGYTTKEKAATLIGKKVVWTSPAGKELIGKITLTHGNSGAVRAAFETGMPGQCIGTKVKIE